MTHEKPGTSGITVQDDIAIELDLQYAIAHQHRKNSKPFNLKTAIDRFNAQ